MFNNETRDSVTITDISQLQKNDTTVEVIEIPVGYYCGNINITWACLSIGEDPFRSQCNCHFEITLSATFIYQQKFSYPLQDLLDGSLPGGGRG